MIRSAREPRPPLSPSDRTVGGPVASSAGPPVAARVPVLAAALSAVVIWAGTPIATKLAVGVLDPLAVGLFRTLLGTLIALPLLLLRRHRPPATGSARRLLAVSALGGFVVFPLLFSLGVERTTAAHGALALALLPILTGLIAAGVDRRPPGPRWWAGGAVALVGTWLLIDRRFGLAAPGASVEGDLIVLLSCLAASAGYVAGARAAREIGTEAVTLWGLVVGGLLLLPLVPFVVDPEALVALDAGIWVAVAYLGVLSSIVAYAAWYWALAQGDIGRTGLIQFLQPFLGLLFAVAVLGETLTWPLVASGLVIVAGVALAQSRPAAAKVKVAAAPRNPRA